MDGNFGYQLILIAFIVLLNGFFAGAEVALVSSRPSRLRALADDGVVGAQAAISLLSNPERLLSVVQVGVTLTSLALGSAGEETFKGILLKIFGPLLINPGTEHIVEGFCIVLAFIVMTFLHVVIGEVVPKNIAIETTDRLAVLMAPPLLVFSRIVDPFVFILEKSAAWLSRAIGLRSGGHLATHSVEELKFILTASQRERVLSEFAGTGMQRMMELQEYLTREIMVPRNQVVAVPVDSSLDNLLKTANEHQFTRVPVYEGRPENIIGYVHSKDLLRVWEERRIAMEQRRAVRVFDIRRIMRRLPIVPESKPVIQLMDEFRKSHTHMAQVVDEFGTFVGVVTLEDLVEQIFGEIEDEHDLRRPMVHRTAATLHLEGTIPIRDLEMQYGIVLPAEGGYETLAGFLLYKLGRIPEDGDSVTENGRQFVVEQMARNRIARVRIETVTAPAN
ncbi:MAG: hemolysin family protein [Bryobacteraceae bacterium]|nr:hemolysin family protein [Bryobacteraceae bacterium]